MAAAGASIMDNGPPIWHLTAMKTALLIYRLLVVALLTVLAFFHPGAIIFYLFWGVHILIGWVAYVDNVTGGIYTPRNAFEYAYFFWCWEFPPYRPGGRL
jgi:hypothetical protein